MTRVKLGDIFEIATPKGLAYGQYINRHKMYGALIRVFCGLHTRRPNEWAQAMGEVQFIHFFPLQSAVNHGDVSIVGHVPVSPEVAKLPIFRSGIADPATGKVAVWWFWDGEKEWRVGTLKPEQLRMPILGVCDVTYLIERIVEGWRPENDPTT